MARQVLRPWKLVGPRAPAGDRVRLSSGRQNEQSGAVQPGVHASSLPLHVSMAQGCGCWAGHAQRRSLSRCERQHDACSWSVRSYNGAATAGDKLTCKRSAMPSPVVRLLAQIAMQIATSRTALAHEAMHSVVRFAASSSQDNSVDVHTLKALTPRTVKT
jgi:hypothetical protein